MKSKALQPCSLYKLLYILLILSLQQPYYYLLISIMMNLFILFQSIIHKHPHRT
jgi:hypothetical protein